MRLQIPPIIPYVVGAMLVIFGVLRVKYLSAPRVRDASDSDGAESAPVEEVPVRGKEQRRHLRMGIIWVLLGLFLVVSTFIQTHRR